MIHHILLHLVAYSREEQELLRERWVTCNKGSGCDSD